MSLNLTPRQRIALRNPCFRAEQVTQKKFYDLHLLQRMTSGLTFNVGME